MQELVLQYEAKVGRLENQQRERMARPDKVSTFPSPSSLYFSVHRRSGRMICC